MKELDDHCANLSMLVSGYEPEIEWPHQAEWLNVASGIKKIEFDVIRFDKSCGWCSGADQFSLDRERILREYVTELTRFTYVWGALESLIDDLNLPEGGQRKGKINAICHYLKNKLDPNEIICPYADLIERLRYIIEKYDVNKTAMLKRFNASHLSMHGLGVYVIYNLRNSLVHGSIDFPFPEEDKAGTVFSEVVNISTRIILLTLQMIWLAYYRGTGILIPIHWESNGDDCDKKYYLEGILREIHLKDYTVQRENANHQLEIQWEKF